jgi:electron transfer flavoprotein alpha subunit
MSVIVFAELKEGKGTKAGFEAVSYATKAATVIGGDVHVVVAGPIEGDGGFGNFGAKQVHSAATVHQSDSMQLTDMVHQAVKQTGATTVVLSHDATGKLVGPRLAIRLNAGMVAGATGLPEVDGGFVVRKSVFSGKASAHVKISTDAKIISIVPNAFGLKPIGGTAAVASLSVETSAATVKVREFKPTATDGSIPLPEADLVVSAGRGLKGPEHWGIIEELAKELGAATACSRPVSDIGWRPHHEHVGQTGIAIRPTLYIAVGISGAIQHLAGVNQSKVIVVINKDPEAPFFKAADYGIVGDAFEVVPKLIEAIQAFKQN